MDAETTPTAAAMVQLHEAVSGLVDAVETGGLDHLEPGDKLTFWQEFEAERRRLPLVDHALIGDAQRTDLAGHFAFASLSMLLVKTLRLSPAEAAGRVHAAGAVGARLSMLGEPLDPLLPILAEAQRDGEVSTEQVGIVERAVRELRRPDLDPAAAVDVEQTLTEHARTFGPKDLRLISRRLVDALDPDGTEPDSAQQERRHLELRQLRNGMWRIEGRLTGATGAQLSALLGPLAKPRPLKLRGEDGVAFDAPDPRHYGQRCHDALDEIVARLLKSDDVPACGGTPTSVVVTVKLTDLLRRAGLAETSDGTLLTAEELIRMANEAEIWTVVTDAVGTPLALGRTRRLATPGQTAALAARDGGCSFPTCTRPPAWCDRHHILDWIAGGRTDLNNLTLLCRYHHTHFAQHGWTARMSADGLPEWIPPRSVDPSQRPILSDRIRRRRAEHTLIA